MTSNKEFYHVIHCYVIASNVVFVCSAGSNKPKVNIQINSTDQCFWKGSSLTNPGRCEINCEHESWLCEYCICIIWKHWHTYGVHFCVFFFLPAINLTCQSDYDNQKGNVDIINVKLNITSHGKTIFHL